MNNVTYIKDHNLSIKFFIDSTNSSRVDNPEVSDSGPTTTEENNETGNMAVTCKTKLGKAVEFLFGQSTEVLQFDKARQQLKQSPSDKFFLAKFMKLVAVTEVQVVKKQTQIRMELGQWEKEFFLKHNRVATQKDIVECSHAKLLKDKLKYAQAISGTDNESLIDK